MNNMSKKQKLIRGAALRRALIATSLPLLAASGLAQQSTNQTEQLKPVIVTGSYIPTAETVGPAPVDVISAADIEKTGSRAEAFEDILWALLSSTEFQTRR